MYSGFGGGFYSASGVYDHSSHLEIDIISISSVQTRGIVTRSGFARGICEIGDFIKLKETYIGIPREQVREGKARPPRKPPDFTMHPLCTLLIQKELETPGILKVCMY